jgi:hypothetical protein
MYRNGDHRNGSKNYIHHAMIERNTPPEPQLAGPNIRPLPAESRSFPPIAKSRRSYARDLLEIVA